jgi:spore maturation protein CgeB
VHGKLGDVWDGYRLATAKARCVFTHSSKDDLIARVFESLAMKKPLVCNRVSALGNHFVDGVHLISFPSNDLWTAALAVESVLDRPEEAKEMAERGWKKVRGETYDARVEEVLEVIGV